MHREGVLKDEADWERVGEEDSEALVHTETEDNTLVDITMDGVLETLLHDESDVEKEPLEEREMVGDLV